MFKLVTQNNEVYTGRAGDGWVSADHAEAFTYGRQLADATAERFNRASRLHGLTFSVVEA